MPKIGFLHAADVSFLRNAASAGIRVYKVQVPGCKLIMLQSAMYVYILTATRCHGIPDKHRLDCAGSFIIAYNIVGRQASWSRLSERIKKRQSVIHLVCVDKMKLRLTVEIIFEYRVTSSVCIHSTSWCIQIHSYGVQVVNI